MWVCGQGPPRIGKNFEIHFWCLHMVKYDWPPQYDQPVSHLKFSSSDLACTWSEMIDPPSMADQDLT